MNLFDLCVYKNLNKGSGGDVDVSSLVATENKTYNAGEGKAYNPVVVNVPTPSPSLQSLTASHNGYFLPSSGYVGFSEVNVDVPLPQNAYLLESQKNDVVTIQHGAEFDMPKLVADITPKQDLHGYDAPWAGGSRKNKLPNAVNTMTVNGITITKNSDGTYTLNGTSTTDNTTICLNSPTGEGDDDYDLSLPNGDYYLSGLSDGTSSTYRMRVDISISDHQSRSISHFDGDTSFTIENNNTCTVSLWINKEGQIFNNFVISPMIRSTTESSTFEPYENDCPISGWSEANVTRCGKNLVNWKWNTFNDGKMEIFLKGGTYTLSAESALTNGNAYIRGTKPSGEYVSREELGLTDWGASSTSGVYYGGGGQQTYTFNVPNGGAKIEFGKLNNNGTISAQLEIGSTPTTYEPYNGHTYTIDLDGTRYGGTLDVLSGVLTITDGFIASYNGETLPSTWISDRDVYAEGTTPTTGAEVCYKLETPQTYQLTPTEVKSLLGVNNIFADTGEVDVQIWTKEVTS